MPTASAENNKGEAADGPGDVHSGATRRDVGAHARACSYGGDTSIQAPYGACVSETTDQQEYMPSTLTTCVGLSPSKFGSHPLKMPPSQPSAGTWHLWEQKGGTRPRGTSRLTAHSGQALATAILPRATQR